MLIATAVVGADCPPVLFVEVAELPWPLVVALIPMRPSSGD